MRPPTSRLIWHRTLLPSSTMEKRAATIDVCALCACVRMCVEVCVGPPTPFAKFSQNQHGTQCLRRIVEERKMAMRRNGRRVCAIAFENSMLFVYIIQLSGTSSNFDIFLYYTYYSN